MSSLSVLSEADVEKSLDMMQLINELKQALIHFSSGNGVNQPVRTVLPIPKFDGFFGVMPVYSEHDNIIAVKLVSFYPQNISVPTHNAQVLVFNPSDGTCLGIMAGERLTALRTAAASALATQHIAQSLPSRPVLSLLGSGVQAESHIKSLSCLYKFSEVRVWSHTPQNAAKFAEKHDAKPVLTVEEAVKDADIICTVSSAKEPILFKHWLKVGAHINAVGACRPDWSELDNAIMHSADVYVDSLEACLKESGDIILSQAPITHELGEILALKKSLPRRKLFTVFKSVGLAIEDAVAAKIVLKNFFLLK